MRLAQFLGTNSLTLWSGSWRDMSKIEGHWGCALSVNQQTVKTANEAARLWSQANMASEMQRRDILNISEYYLDGGPVVKNKDIHLQLSLRVPDRKPPFRKSYLFLQA